MHVLQTLKFFLRNVFHVKLDCNKNNNLSKICYPIQLSKSNTEAILHDSKVIMSINNHVFFRACRSATLIVYYSKQKQIIMPKNVL